MIEYFQKILKKYQMFLKYLIVAGLSFGIDIIFFTLFNTFFKISIVVATIMARVISSFINYLLNKNKVFESKVNTYQTIFKYYLLVIIQMSISALVVDNIHKFVTINPSFIKIPVELFLFVCNYLIQKFLIFRRGNHER